MKTIKFQGHEIVYDERKLRSWKVQRMIASNGAAGAFDAIDAVLCGRADEVAELLDDDIDLIGEMLNAILDAEGGMAKN